MQPDSGAEGDCPTPASPDGNLCVLYVEARGGAGGEQYEQQAGHSHQLTHRPDILLRAGLCLQLFGAGEHFTIGGVILHPELAGACLYY